MTARIGRDFNDVHVFTKVVEAGSFTGAARTLGLPKSTVSRRVARLEAELGVRLLQRSTRRLSLTDAGERYYNSGSRLFAELADAESVLTEAQTIPKGRVRVAAPAEHGITSTLVTRFLEEYPLVRVDMVFASRDVNIIEEGFDAAISAGPLDNLSVVAFKLLDSPFRLVASPRYLDEHGAPKRLRDLEKHACIVFGYPSSSPSWTLPAKRGPVRLNITARATFNHLEAVRAAAIAGHGLALLPLLTCGEDIAADRLRVVLPNTRPPAVPVWLTYPSGRYLHRAARVFIDFAKEHFAKIAAPLCEGALDPRTPNKH